MTPEKARELLDGDFKTETRTELVGDVQADFDSFSGAYISATPGHESLYDAADELAETVAGLWYEYTVQVPVDGQWKYTKDDQYGPELLDNQRDATWYPSLRDAAVWADLWDDGKDTPRIVRRLVSEPEVIDNE